MDFGGEAAVEPNDAPDAAEAMAFWPVRSARLDASRASGRGQSVQRGSDNDGSVRPAGAEGMPQAPSGWPIWLIGALIAGLWALGPIAFAFGYRSQVAPLQADPVGLTVFALLAIGPALLVMGAAYMMRQAQKLGFETRRTRSLADQMLTPALLAAARVGDVTRVVRDEIVGASAAAAEARETLLALREALAFETEALTGAAAQSIRAAQELSTTLGRERGEMSVLGQSLDAQAMKVVDAVAQQGKMVADAARVAEAQIRDAETNLAARAADLAAAATQTSDQARIAGEDLTRHIARLEGAGSGLSNQLERAGAGLASQRAALVALSDGLRDDHAGFAAQAEAHAGRLTEFVAATRASTDEMAEGATQGGEALQRMMVEVAAQFRTLSEAAQAERDELGQSTLQALEAVSSAAADQRRQLEIETRGAINALATAADETRAAAEHHAQAARSQVEQLSEAAFAAGQKANLVFEKRLEEARALVEQSAKLVDEAGAAVSAKLEQSAAAARATLDALAATLAEIEARTARLPVAAQGQAEQIREIVADGLEELRSQARRTADEAGLIDTALQERARRNFMMMSEAVKLMGMAGAPLSEPPQEAPRDPEFRPKSQMPRADATAPPTPQLPLRDRIRLTPIASDKEFSAVFESAGGGGAEADEELDPEVSETWTWKDLLASLDGPDGEGERLEATLALELNGMGVDVDRLLPEARIREIAAAIQTDDGEGAREVVRKLAPAAVRRIARRLSTDEVLRRRGEVYLRRYGAFIQDAITRDAEGFGLADLLSADGGRIYLLVDAASRESVG